jgi:hypothetical protein
MQAIAKEEAVPIIRILMASKDKMDMLSMKI